MSYDRNDRRPGGNTDRDRYGYDADRARSGNSGSYGYASRDYRGDRFDARSEYQGDRDRDGNRDEGRGFADRAGDEVRSWFGDEDAERRRREDQHYTERDDRHGRDRGYAASGYGGDFDRNRSWGGDRNREQGQHDHDPHYREWRDRQVQSLDRDYADYRRENQSRFDQEFHGWRQNRKGQRDQLQKVTEHMDVVGSDGAHVGKVDHVRGDHIQLAKNDKDAGGHHHAIPSNWIQAVDDKVTLTKTADQAKQHWREDDRNTGGLFGGQDRDRGTNGNLDRSFSGTYRG